MPILNQDEMDGLWGDGGPYSEVHVDKEVRILDESVSRTFYYVTANLNPTTYELLREAEIPENLKNILNQAEWIDDEHGYLLFFGRLLEHESAELANLERRAIERVLQLHRLAIQRIANLR